MLLRRIKITLLLSLVLSGGFLWLAPVQAQEVVTYQDIQRQGIIFAGVCPAADAPCECRDQGDCTLEDVLQVSVNISIFILAISGSVLLILFVLGGVLWLTSAGNPERVTAGKKTITGAVVGIIIVFSGYAAITLLVAVLKTGSLPTGNLEDVIGDTDGVCSELTPDGDQWPCANDSGCQNWLGLNVDLGICLLDNQTDVIETAE